MRIKVAILETITTPRNLYNESEKQTRFHKTLMIEVRNPRHNKYNPRINRQPFLLPSTNRYSNEKVLILCCTYDKITYHILKDSKGWNY